MHCHSFRQRSSTVNEEVELDFDREIIALRLITA